MDNASINTVEPFIEFILFLDFIEDLEISLNFPLQFNVYVEFHDILLSGENVIVTVLDDAGMINLKVALNFPLNEISEYNNFASYPMLIYFESLNEIERNYQQPIKRNSSIHQTWVCVVDLLPLIYAPAVVGADGTESDDMVVNGRYPLKAIGELNRNLLSDAVTGARLNATVSRPETSPFRASPPPNNVLNVTVHGLYNPPLNGHRRHRHAATTCTATLDVAEAIDPDFHSFVFAHGTYTDITRDVNDLRWYSLDNMSATVSATGQRFEEQDAVVVNSAKIPEPKDVMFKGPRYEWNLWQRFLLNEKSSQTFQDFIFKYMFIKFMFTKNPTKTNNTVFSQELNNQGSNVNVNDEVFHIAFLDLSMLLQPNCTSVRCLSTVHTLDENILQTHGFSSATLITEEFIEKNTIGEQRSKKSSISLLDVSKDSSSQFIPVSSADWISPFVVVDISVSNAFYDQYLKHITKKMLEMKIILEKPLATTRALMTSYKYQECLKTTIKSLIETSVRINNPDGDKEDYYVNELKDSGVYGSMQSILCNEIRQYVMDNYAGPMIGETIQSFVNRIFMDLVDIMKKTVESFEFSHSYGDAENVVKPGHDAMIMYAKEADELKQTERAKKIYFDLISTAGTRCNPNYWLLYASFCSRRLDFDTALKYVKEVLLVDSGNRIGLFLYAAIHLTIHEDNNNGEIVLKSLIMSHGNFSEVYALLSVHYSTLNMYKASYIMLQKALKTIEKDEFEKNNLSHENLLSWQSIGYNNDPLIKCAILLLKHELVELATRCLKLVVNQCEEYHYYMAVCEYKKGNHSTCLEHLEHKILTGKYEKCINTLRYLNDIELNESLDFFENYLLRVMHTEDPRKELHLVYLKGGLRCYTNKWYAKGTEICRIAGNVIRTPMIFTLLAKCLIEIGELEAAENALNEANIMDVKNEEVWAYLTVVNIRMENIDEAKVCYTRALEYGLRPEMKKEINTLLKRRNINI